VKLATYWVEDLLDHRLAVVLDDGPLLAPVPVLAELVGAAREPRDVGEVLAGGPDAFDAVRRFHDACTASPPSTVLEAGEVRLGPPVIEPRVSLIVGSNFRSHVLEASQHLDRSPEPPARPRMFAKLANGYVGSGALVAYPQETTQLDYEVEIAVVLGADVLCVDAEAGDKAIAGFTIMNDLSARDLILSKDMDGTLFGKNFPGSAPLGPWFVSADEFDAAQVHTMRTWINGELRQDGDTGDMVFGFGELVAYGSRMGLRTGDVIATGTPAGVGLFAADPENALLHAGDEIRMEVSGIGVLENFIV
jgi:2-keto-4-pentenoate hydratase/2-oxohepta-3-ene-1,7-dioic acid hydratase in catechol pathway